MFGAIAQLGELIVYHHLEPFLVFFVLTWSIFILRLSVAHRNQPVLDRVEYNKNLTTSAIVFTFHDDPDLLAQSLASIKAQQTPFSEVVIACDAAETPERLEIIRQSGFPTYVDVVGNKRDAFAGALAMTKGEIVVHLAGDTVYPADMNTQALVAFASNPQVGAVAFNQGIYDHKRNLIRRFANIMYGLRFRITYPALSARKSLLCTTGETGYFRRAPLEKHMAEFTNEYFMGRRCVIGDDRFLTSMVLKEGYQAILQQSQAKVLTDCPNTFKNFIKQQLRWYRSNQKYSFKTLLGWIPGRPFLKTHLLAFLLLPYLWVGIVIWWLVNAQLNIYPIEILEKVPGLVILTWVVVGFFLSSFLKTLPYFWAHKEDYRVFPLYVLFSTFIILPTFVYALLTIGDQGGWGTKRSGPPSSKATIGIKLGIFILALILITPLLALEVMTPHDAMATSID